MKLFFTDNIQKSLLEVIKPQLSRMEELRIGVAFAKYSGFSLIKEEIENCLGKDGKVEILLGLDFRTTDPKVLRAIYDMERRGLKIKSFCFCDPAIHDSPVYHPKIYIIKNAERFIISIGSSNLTAGGLKNNIEVNSIIKANIKEEVVSDIHEIYNRIKYHKTRFKPDRTYIENYEIIYETLKRKKLEALKDKDTKKRIKELKEREETLPKPKPTRSELFGWQRLIYERLPENIFTTSKIYPLEEEFQKSYPGNRFIKEKIRQVLQQLREIGLLIHLGKNRWKKMR